LLRFSATRFFNYVETVNFNQPNVSSVTLNRVVGNEKSIIDGALNANGQVFILNSNGVLFSKNASINTAGLVATTMSLSDADFMNGNYSFKGDSTASVINQGTINISDKGYAALFGKEVKNEGIIKATLGKVELVGAKEVTLNLNGNSLVNLKVDKGVLDALVENKGAIYADGGQVYLTTNAVNELLKGVVNNTGIIEAQTLDDVTGKIELFAHGGEAKVGGTIKAEGGFVETSGNKVKIADNFIVKAKTWLIDPTDFSINSGAGALDASGIGADTLSATLSAGTSVTIATDPADNAGETGIIAVYASVEKTGGADATLTLKAHDSIYIHNGVTLSSTTNKLNVVLWADSDNSGSGAIYMSSGSGISTNSGHVWMGGGSGTVTDWNGYGINVGNGTAKSDNNYVGIDLNNVTIDTSISGDSDYSHYGTITLNGYSNSTIAKEGIMLRNGTVLKGNSVSITGQSTTGDGVRADELEIDANSINISGTGGDNGGNGGRGFASLTSDNIFTARAGGISINGTASIGAGAGINAIGTFNSAGGIYFTGTSAGGTGIIGGDLGSLVINNTSTDNVWLYGSSLAGNGDGIWLTDGASLSITTPASGGNISLIGVGHGTGSGINIDHSGAVITAGSGIAVDENQNPTTHIGLWINGTGGASGHGVKMSGYYYAVDGEISVTGTGGATTGKGILIGADGDTYLGRTSGNGGRNTLGVILDGTATGGNNDGINFSTNYSTTITTLSNGYVKILGHGFGSGYGIDMNNENTRIYAGNGSIPGLAGYSLYMNATGGIAGSGTRIAGEIESAGNALLTGSVGGGSDTKGFEVLGGSIYSEGTLGITGNAQSATGNAHGVVFNYASISSDTDALEITGIGHGNGHGIYFTHDNDYFTSISADGGAIILDGRGQVGAGFNIYQDTTAPIEFEAPSVNLKGNGGSIWLGHESNEIDAQYGVDSTTGTPTVDFTLVSGNNDLTLGRIDTTGTINIYTVNDGPITLTSAISTTSTADDAIIINAGRDIPAGTVTNQNDDEVNIVVEDGSPVRFTTGAGGTVKLYTGSITNSTGIGAMATSSNYKIYNGDKDTDLSNYVNEFGNGKYIIYREASSGGSNTPDPEPIPTPIPQSVVNIITAIINNEGQTIPLIPSVPPLGNPVPQKVHSFGGKIVEVTSIPPNDTPVEIVALSELDKAQENEQDKDKKEKLELSQEDSSKKSGIREDVRVPLFKNSEVDIVNGGVRLPSGLQQLFFMAQR